MTTATAPVPAAAVRSVGVVGAGAVGQAVATALVAARWCEQLLITSRTPEQAAALVADLDDMRLTLGSPVIPKAATVRELRDCPAVVVAARARFTNSNYTNVRMGGLHANTPIIAELAAQLCGYRGVVVMVTNPVDLMARVFAETSGARVVGVGSNLDSARYRLALARLHGVRPQDIDGSVIGEHGDALVICASSTTVNGQPVSVPVEQIRAVLLGRSGVISEGIGRTRAGPAGAVLSTLTMLLGLVDGVTELSTPHQGCWYGAPVRFTSGRASMEMPTLDAAETAQLTAAQAKLRATYTTLAQRLAAPAVPAPRPPPAHQHRTPPADLFDTTGEHPCPTR